MERVVPFVRVALGVSHGFIGSNIAKETGATPAEAGARGVGCCIHSSSPEGSHSQVTLPCRVVRSSSRVPSGLAVASFRRCCHCHGCHGGPVELGRCNELGLHQHLTPKR